MNVEQLLRRASSHEKLDLSREEIHFVFREMRCIQVGNYTSEVTDVCI